MNLLKKKLLDFELLSRTEFKIPFIMSGIVNSGKTFMSSNFLTQSGLAQQEQVIFPDNSDPNTSFYTIYFKSKNPVAKIKWVKNLKNSEIIKTYCTYKYLSICEDTKFSNLDEQLENIHHQRRQIIKKYENQHCAQKLMQINQQQYIQITGNQRILHSQILSKYACLIDSIGSNDMIQNMKESQKDKFINYDKGIFLLITKLTNGYENIDLKNKIIEILQKKGLSKFCLIFNMHSYIDLKGKKIKQQLNNISNLYKCKYQQIPKMFKAIFEGIIKQNKEKKKNEKNIQQFRDVLNDIMKYLQKEEFIKLKIAIQKHKNSNNLKNYLQNILPIIQILDQFYPLKNVVFLGDSQQQFLAQFTKKQTIKIKKYLENQTLKIRQQHYKYMIQQNQILANEYSDLTIINIDKQLNLQFQQKLKKFLQIIKKFNLQSNIKQFYEAIKVHLDRIKKDLIIALFSINQKRQTYLVYYTSIKQEFCQKVTKSILESTHKLNQLLSNYTNTIKKRFVSFLKGQDQFQYLHLQNKDIIKGLIAKVFSNIIRQFFENLKIAVVIYNYYCGYLFSLFKTYQIKLQPKILSQKFTDQFYDYFTKIQQIQIKQILLIGCNFLLFLPILLPLYTLEVYSKEDFEKNKTLERQDERFLTKITPNIYKLEQKVKSMAEQLKKQVQQYQKITSHISQLLQLDIYTFQDDLSETNLITKEYLLKLNDQLVNRKLQYSMYLKEIEKYKQQSS